MFPIGIYIHIPFCLRKCFYCDFNSIPIGIVKKNILALIKEKEKLLDRYAEALCREIKSSAIILAGNNFFVESIFIGGGTPSLIKSGKISEILNICKNAFHFSDNPEITIETNPGTISYDSLKGYLESGINRLSLGCQSFSNEELKSIGRVHSAEDIYRSLKIAQEAGFENINIDLIFGIPRQDLESFSLSLKKALSLKPQHISVYNLTIEADTVFYKLKNKGKLKLPDDDEQIAMYEQGIKTLTAEGFEHYEISNFALQGKRCLHNENYWRHGEYLGFGAGAHSFLRSKEQGAKKKGKRWWNLKDAGNYCEAVEKGISPTENKEELNESKLISEATMLGLRMMEGIDIKDFFNKYGVQIEEKYKNEIESLRNQELLVLENNRLKLPLKGTLFSNEVFLRFVPYS